MAPMYLTASQLAMAFFLAVPAHGFWRMSCSVVQTSRVDPVISFGKVSQHVHKISGANNININSTHDSLSEASCTSCQIQADKSAYWTPQLYYMHADGQFEEVPNGGIAAYYLGRGRDANGGTLASPFPKGLKFLSGRNDARSYDDKTLTYNGNPTYPGTPIADRVTFSCVDYNNPQPETHFMANTDCPNGMRAQITFQACWDGVNLYKDDQSHMAYLSQIDNGICPPSHPILLPVLFIEVPYDVNTITKDGGKFVFANGDETGYGFHGDFINGWDIPTLTAAISECLLDNEAGVIEYCRAFDQSNVANYEALCPETTSVYPCEPVHGKIAHLPGCITPTGFDHVVVPSDNTCPGGNVAACDPNFFNRPPAPYAGNAQYEHLGCYTEPANARALADKRTTSMDMTAEACIEFCGGSNYVAVEYSSECYCGSSLNSQAAKAPSTDCAMTCTGNRWEICGGPNRLNVFRKQ